MSTSAGVFFRINVRILSPQNQGACPGDQEGSDALCECELVGVVEEVEHGVGVEDGTAAGERV